MSALPVGLQLKGRRCVVVGPADDREADQKVALLRAAGAAVEWLQDPAAFDEAQLADAFFVISTPLDATLSERLRRLADRHRFLLCTIDQPAYGTVAMLAQVAAGTARIGISTGGASPRVGSILAAALAQALDGRFARFLERVAERRRATRERYPDEPAQRRAGLRAAVEGFACEVHVQYPAWFTESEGR